MNSEEAQEYLKGIRPDAAKELVRFLAPEMEEIAARVSAYGLSSGRRRALGIVGQMGAELGAAAAQLFDSDRWYAGSALVRQLIEVEYLLYLFVTDPAEADQWLEAPLEKARSMYSPKNMRERSAGRFNAEEYSLHCEYGGHPRLRGSVLLRERLTVTQNDPVKLFNPSTLWVDLSQHMERMWGHFSAAVCLHSPSNFYEDRFVKIDEKIKEWHRIDPLPRRI